MAEGCPVEGSVPRGRNRPEPSARSARPQVDARARVLRDGELDEVDPGILGGAPSFLAV